MRHLKYTALLLGALLLPPFMAEAAGSPPADSLSIKIGQMLMVGFRGTTAESSPDIRRAIRENHIGGVVLFDYDVPSRSRPRNIVSPEQLARLTLDLQTLSGAPLLIAIDQEGGKVSRLKEAAGFPPSVTAEHLGNINSPDTTTAAARRTARTLRNLNINMNLAPVVDLNTNPRNPVIGGLGRSFSAHPDRVIQNASLTLDAFEKEGILGTLKHFPGHGSSTTDSHLGFTDVTASWSPSELLPYRKIIADGFSGAVMTAHVFNASLDPRYPATLSEATVTGLLRRELGFKGVVLSDDMQMKAIADHYGLEEAVALAINAGVDILVFANNTSRYEPRIARQAAEIIRTLVRKGDISPQRIDASFSRIMALKKQLPLNHQKAGTQ
ncbi:MAG: glycoside hydrolase family 3 N-terminal domain-containing protein [Chlorobium phaeovibrioides]|nr:glycoside hydrolase family 3 N-terminal domain-containing protein [Chlorobium phaeovibrioides]